MPRRTKLHFNHIEKYGTPTPFDGLTYVLRTDANHATGLLKQHLVQAFNAAANPATIQRVQHTVHTAYREWGHSVLNALSQDLDYGRYGIEDEQNKFLNVHFYNANQLTRSAVQNSQGFLRGTSENARRRPIFFISLDDMIEKQTPHWGDIAFSRLFSDNGSQQLGYRARPGTPALDLQFKKVRDILKAYQQRHGTQLPIVLLEDNVRHAKMLNWVIDQMDQHNIFDYGRLAGISTCFCCATAEERNAIRYQDNVVPLSSVVDYKDAKIDIVTPRDLMFDGFVVDTPQGPGRLPGIFMDVAQLFKIDPSREADFRRKVHRANIKFCETLEKKFGTTIPLGWFAGAGAIAHLTQRDAGTPMTGILNAAQENWQRMNGTNDNGGKQRQPNRLLAPS